MTYYQYFDCFFGILKVLKEVIRNKINPSNEILTEKELAEVETSAILIKDLKSILAVIYNMTPDSNLTRIILHPIQVGLL